MKIGFDVGKLANGNDGNVERFWDKNDRVHDLAHDKILVLFLNSKNVQ